MMPLRYSNLIANPDLPPHILNGEIHHGPVFDRTVGLNQVAKGYRLMNDREALKVIVRP
jgi:threonine dehydrogenase-like Zn-dependent dehydrogenase